MPLGEEAEGQVVLCCGLAAGWVVALRGEWGGESSTRSVLSFTHVPQAFFVITNVALKELEDKGKARFPGHPQTLPPRHAFQWTFRGAAALLRTIPAPTPWLHFSPFSLRAISGCIMESKGAVVGEVCTCSCNRKLVGTTKTKHTIQYVQTI